MRAPEKASTRSHKKNTDERIEKKVKAKPPWESRDKEKSDKPKLTGSRVIGTVKERHCKGAPAAKKIESSCGKRRAQEVKFDY